MIQPPDLRISKDTRLCISLSGRPGNFGTRFHNFLYRELNLDFIYKAFATQDLAAAIGGVRALGIRGCAVSMPFKETCLQFLDELDPSVEGIMSVNTIVNEGGHLKAYNTDYLAVFQLLKSHGISKELQFALHGSGGMAKAVACALKDLGSKDGLIVARNEMKGKSLADQYGYRWVSRLSDQDPKLLINVTPIGMKGGNEENSLSFSESYIQSALFVFDVVATSPETPLIQRARSLAKNVISGLEVTVLQAVEQFVLYTGVRPNQDLIDKAAAFARS